MHADHQPDQHRFLFTHLTSPHPTSSRFHRPTSFRTGLAEAIGRIALTTSAWRPVLRSCAMEARGVSGAGWGAGSQVGSVGRDVEHGRRRMDYFNDMVRVFH